MPLTDEQLDRVITKVSGWQADHDLLVKISTSIEMMNKAYRDDRTKVISDMAMMDNKVGALHSRCDNITKDISKLHWMLSGAVVAVSGVTTIATLIIKLT